MCKYSGKFSCLFLLMYSWFTMVYWEIFLIIIIIIYFLLCYYLCYFINILSLFYFLFPLSTKELLFAQILPLFFRVSIFILFPPCFHLFVFLFSGWFPQLLTWLLIELCISVLIHLFSKNYCFVLSEISIFSAYYSYFIVAMFSFYLRIVIYFCFDFFSLDSLCFLQVSFFPVCVLFFIINSSLKCLVILGSHLMRH